MNMIMKKFNKIFAATLLAILGIGCSDFGDTNVSPNAAETPLTSALLTNALTTLGGTTAFTTAGLYCQYYSETQYTDVSRYSLQNISWSGDMAGSMYDLQNIININSDPSTAEYAAFNGSNANQIAVARILRAYRFSLLTDRYGDMPYSQALLGESQPVFDTQEEIYNGLFTELAEAVNQFDNGAPVKGDILFDGDQARWKKFANSFRLILALRLSKIDAAKGEQEFNDALNADGGVFDSNDDNATIAYPGGAYKNPWYGIGGDFGVSETIASFLNGNSDNRLNAFGNPANGVLVGVPYGLQRNDAIEFTGSNPDWSLILNDTYRQATSSLNVLAYSDVLLARAEAAFIGWTDEDYTQLYQDGIQASWEAWGVFEQEAFDAYMQKPAIALAPGLEAELIGTQRWLSFFPNGMQGWSEWRRTGYPVLAPSPAPVNTSGEIPRRFPYYSAEYNLNGVNLQAAVDRINGGDTMDGRVWWDVE
jgi:hypothetical protein